MKRALFLHMPKTGGTSLYRMLCERYGADAVHNPRIRADGPSPLETEHPIVFGHFQFTADLFARFDWIGTMLRHPVSRIFSLYRHARVDPRAPLHEAARELDFSGFIRFEAAQLANDQTRRLAGWQAKYVNATAFAQAQAAIRTLHYIGAWSGRGCSANPPFLACMRSIEDVIGHRMKALAPQHERDGQRLSPDVPLPTPEDCRLIISRNHFDLALWGDVRETQELRRPR